jgi:hypothetical protein
MSDRDKGTVDKALDVLVYGPLGLALYVRDTVPGFFRIFVSRGKSEVARHRRIVDRQVSRARSTGAATAGAGVPVRERVGEGIRGARQFAEQAMSGLVVAGDGHDSHAADDIGIAESDASARLAIPDYDELSASQVVERLEGLRPRELAEIRRYEESRRGRRTILFKIDQLAR